MTATTKSRKSTPAPAKRPARASSKAAKPEPTPEPAKTEATVPAKSTYREVADFTPALKAAKSLAKGNPDLSQPLQLITHLAWKTPGGTVGWAKGTTANVVAFADDIAVPAGTPIPDAMSAALSVAEKAATEQPQKDAVAVLSKVIKGHA
jgi:hypothetical protein